MQEVWEFTKAVCKHWGVLLAGAAILAAFRAAQFFLDLSPPDYFLWATALVCLSYASYLAWDVERQRCLEYQQGTLASAPQVLVQFDCEAERPKPVTLINASDIPAFKVKIHDIQNGDRVAKFEALSQLLREWVAVDPKVEVNGSGAVGSRSLMTVLEDGSEGGKLGSRVFPLRVSYTDFQGREFQTQYEIEYHGANRRAVARLKPAAMRNGGRRARLKGHAWDRR